MRLHYISPSVLPSRSANSVHVVHQCDGLTKAGAKVILYAKRNSPDASTLPAAIERVYGVDPRRIELLTHYQRFDRAETLAIALRAIGPVMYAPDSDRVLTRNLHAAWALAGLRRPLLFETHQLEYGVRKTMQRSVMLRPWVRTVVISNSLANCLEEHHNIRLRDPLVLHDAAPDDIVGIPVEERRVELAALLGEEYLDLSSWRAVCGYFGQLYAGRGIEIIEAMAVARPDCLFIVCGGRDTVVNDWRSVAPTNMRFMGHVPHPVARNLQAACDILLMPYQQNVSIGVHGHDTARWMSPMKMFEYMASSVPIISSDLPALREVLVDNYNALLVAPDQPISWVEALDRLVATPALAASIGRHAHEQYRRKHTWTRRAEALLAAAQAL